MCFLKYCKIVSLLIVINSCSSSYLLDSGSDTYKAGQLFKKLESCLTSVGVKNKNLIYRDSGDEYTCLNWQWNTFNGTVKPLAYLNVHKVSDIQKAIICCRSIKIRIVAQVGGHSYVKNGFGDSNSLILNLKELNGISPDPIQMNCAIEGGARNGLIISTLAEKNFLIPVGICPTVGIVGLSLGGGYGYFTRQYGLTSDNLLELEMVDAKGNLLKINSTSNADLFFALRGGGGGIYGIVTKLKLKMYPVPESISYGVFNYTFTSDFSSFFEAWQLLIARLPKNAGTITIMKENVITMTLYIINLTKSSKDSDEISKILSSYSFPNHLADSWTDEISYNDFLLNTSQIYTNKKLTHVSELANITRHNQVGSKKVKSFYVNKILDRDGIDKLYHLLGECLKTESSSIAFLQNGGAINDFSRSETAFIHRGNLYDVQLAAFSKNYEAFERADSAIKTFYEASKTVLNHRESYQNYLDQDIPDYLERYYGENLKKLSNIKMRIDPENVFYHGRSIPTISD